MNDLSRVFVVDLETTGLKPEEGATVCEYAIYSCLTGDWNAQLVNPEVPIPCETSAVHHITDDDVTHAPKWSDISSGLKTTLAVPPGTPLPILVAHNAAFEKSFLSVHLPPVLWICTYKCALRVWPDAPNHKNETLRYWLRLGHLGRSAPAQTHSAKHDVWVTTQIFEELLKHATLDQLIEWSDLPAKFPKVPFGKHAGQNWSEVPQSYFAWCKANIKDNPDLIYNIREEEKRRYGK